MRCGWGKMKLFHSATYHDSYALGEMNINIPYDNKIPVKKEKTEGNTKPMHE